MVSLGGVSNRRRAPRDSGALASSLVGPLRRAGTALSANAMDSDKGLNAGTRAVSRARGSVRASVESATYGVFRAT